MENIDIMQMTSTHKKGISGSTLKMIAIISMVIDHIGAIILEQMLIQRGFLEVTDTQIDAFIDANALLYFSDLIMRTIGRIAFPIFCFLIVQGFLHTHNLQRYLKRLLLFACISEIPFDLAFSNRIIDWEYQNVFFTLSLGVLALSGMRFAERKEDWNILKRISFTISIVGLCLFASYVLKVDYGIYGVLVIVIMYLFRRHKTLSTTLGCIPLMGISPFASLIPIHFYNGKKGRNIKYLFYFFYPAHILILYFLSFIFL